MFERAEAVHYLLYSAATAALMMLMLCTVAVLIDVKAARRHRRVPWAAIVLTGLAVIGLVLQHTWSGAFALFDDDPTRSGWWRVITAVFMQNGGPVGSAWNLVTLAVIAAAAGLTWGNPLTLVLFLAGAILPAWVQDLFGFVSVSQDPRNFAGSSGVTYFLGATLAAVLLVRAAVPLQQRVLAGCAPVLGVVSFALIDNAHGLVTVEGFVLGLILAVLLRRVRRPRPAEPTRPGRQKTTIAS